MQFGTRFMVPSADKLDFRSEKPLTEQHHKDDCDINVIFARFSRTGILGDPSFADKKGVYMDVTDLPVSYKEALDLVREADESFQNLPAKIRLRFNNNPEELNVFLENPANYEEAVELGIVTRRAPVNQAVGTKPSLDITVPTDTKSEKSVNNEK